MKICQNIEEMLPSQFVLLNIMKSKFCLYPQKGPKIYKFLSINQIPDDFNCKMSLASNSVKNSYWVKLPFEIDGRYVY